MTLEEIKIAERHISSVDSVLADVIQNQKIEFQPERINYFESLCESIISQQISVAAARSIHSRFVVKTNQDPSIINNLTVDEIKQVGLSKQKASYIKDIASHFLNNPELYNHLESQTDERVIKELTKIKGVGVWTAQMFLMFALGRPNVFAPDDVGLQRAMMRAYNWENVLPKKELTEFAERWSPYKTIACRHLWKYLDNSPVY